MALGGLPGVNLREIDLSIQPKITQTFIEAGAVESPRGSLLPQFVPNTNYFRARYFPTDKRYKRGLSTTILEAEVVLEKSALWLVRVAHDDITYAGMDIPVQGTTDTDGNPVQPSPWTASRIMGYDSLGEPFNPDEDQPEFSDSNIVAYIIAESPGHWGNSISVRITNLDATGKVPNSDLIEVFVDGEKVEEFYVSTDPNAKFNGKPLFLPQVLKQSAYIRGFVNPLNFGKKLQPTGSTPVSLGAGDDGSAVTTGDYIKAIERLKGDTYKYQVINDFGIADPSYALKLTEIAQEKRSFATLSVPYEDVASSNYVTQIIDYRENQLSISGDLSSFAGLYGNWLKVYNPDIDDTLYLSPSCFAGKVIAHTWANYNPWYPPAGFKRGYLTALDVRRRMSVNEMGLLYDKGINPIRFAPGKGLAIFGQKTLYPFLSALDRINVRLLLNYVELVGKEYLESFIFDLNDKTTWDLAYSGMDTLFRDLKARGAFYDYKVFYPGDATTPLDIDNHIMRIPVAVKPVKSVEWIDFTIGIIATGGDLNILAQVV